MYVTYAYVKRNSMNVNNILYYYVKLVRNPLDEREEKELC